MAKALNLSIGVIPTAKHSISFTEHIYTYKAQCVNFAMAFGGLQLEECSPQSWFDVTNP